MATQTLITAQQLSRTSKTGKPLLNNICLNIRTGEYVQVVGPSGAGKSLLLRALAWLDPWLTGALYWQGKKLDLKTIPAYRASVMYFPQQPILLPGTVGDNLRLPFSLQQHRKKIYDEASLLSFLKALGRGPEFLQQTMSYLSGGEQQIVALLRGLQLQPQLLLLDEAFSALDLETRTKMEHALKNSLGSEQAVIFVSHQQEQGLMPTRTLNLRGGALV